MVDKPEPVTAYVRHRIERWEAEGRTLKEMQLLGWGKKSSMPSQVKAKTSAVTNVSGPIFAKVFGFADYPELVATAYAWARTGKDATAEGSALAEGVRRALEYGVTQDQIDRAIASVGEERREHSTPSPGYPGSTRSARSISARTGI